MAPVPTVQKRGKGTVTFAPLPSPNPRNRSRIETNLLRLLVRVEVMAMDTVDIQSNWRLEKYLGALEVMLNDLRTGPNQPDRDTLYEYGRRTEFIKGILHTAKLPTLQEKVVASQLISPGPSGNAVDNNPSMEIKHRHATKYAEDLRRELMGDSPSSHVVQQGNLQEDSDELLKYHHKVQEQIAEHMIELTRSLKDQAKSAGQIIKNDTDVLEKSNRMIDSNQSALKIESQKLEMYNKSACKCWVWILLVIVCSTFVSMVLFMRLFKKRSL